jgi:hypothetical protein
MFLLKYKIPNKKAGLKCPAFFIYGLFFALQNSDLAIIFKYITKNMKIEINKISIETA